MKIETVNLSSYQNMEKEKLPAECIHHVICPASQIGLEQPTQKTVHVQVKNLLRRLNIISNKCEVL